MSEKQELYDAVDEFAEAMKKRLLTKLKQRWYGWKRPNDYNIPDRLLIQAANARSNKDQKSLVDTANFAMFMFVYNRRK